MNWAGVLAKLTRQEDLSVLEVREAMGEVMNGQAGPAVIAAFLVGLKSKGETVGELRALADVMVEHARPFRVEGPVLDIVGTGGDMAHTVNISTMASLVCAGAGVKVVKHGNRASSSSSGTADVLEELGLDLSTAPDRLEQQAVAAPMTFLFAQVFHPAMAHAAPVRRQLGIPTAFNFLGPLTNPAGPAMAAIGCSDTRMAPVMAGVFADRGTDAAVFRGDDGLDELTVATSSRVWWAYGGSVHELSLAPEDVGLRRAPLDALRGGDARHNAGVVRELLDGEAGPVRDAVLLNAGIALALTRQQATGELFGGAPDLAAAVQRGVEEAAASIDSGAAANVLRQWIEVTSA